ncbi:isoprene synthase, chloroplastic-like [Alnus glutinosa]|uniref:isoprene synthase, chloroplastic-like n=1 Tax=Alnus glutinosa TaxID=3517 RepID=UPI002D77BE3F|nr:isoprene synthase, chloroplastic-like [Alnus glutinosa]
MKQTPLLLDHKCGQGRSFAKIQTSPLQVERQSANYQPSFWSYDFVQSLNSDYADQRYKDKAKKLEEDAGSMINNENADLLETLELIDDLQRLGLGYRFERDITRTLDNFASSKLCNERIEKSLHATALSFRLLRQQGYQVSQDVFNSFKDHSGNFKECLRKDVKGMLSLYEASYLAYEGEILLEEAMAFTRMHLKDLKADVSKSMAEQVSHTLEVSLHRGMLRLEARWYIEAYNKREDANSLLHELAKLDFNIVQSVLQSDLQDMSRSTHTEFSSDGAEAVLLEWFREDLAGTRPGFHRKSTCLAGKQPPLYWTTPSGSTVTGRESRVSRISRVFFGFDGSFGFHGPCSAGRRCQPAVDPPEIGLPVDYRC